jgi:glucose-1-phosphatase
VLVHVNNDKLRKGLLAEGVSEKAFDAFFKSDIVQGRFEKGLLSTREFLRVAVKRLGNRLTQKELLPIFQDMFEEKPDMKSFLIKLVKEKEYKLIMLSNTNPIHYNYGKKHFQYIYLIKNRALSYKLKLIKPDKRIYIKVLKRYHLKPLETLFIDDKQRNCDAAEALGIKTIHFIDYKSFLKQFKLITSNR